MNLLFEETFETIREDLPGAWMIERNSDLMIPAMEMKEGAFGLQSAGNKYVAITPDVKDFALEALFSINFDLSGSFFILLAFRYDLFSHTGYTFRISRKKDVEETLFEIGTTDANIFTPIAGESFVIDSKHFFKPMKLKMEVKGKVLKAEFCGQKLKMAFPDAGKAGKIALSREHFYDILSVHEFKIWSDDPGKVPEKRFRIPMPANHTMHPIFCDCILKDYGNCMDMEMTLSGGVKATPIGEGNYHAMRVDFMTDFFLKVLTASETQTYIVYQGDIILVNDKLAPLFMFKIFHKKPDWPLTRKVRFIKPEGKFDLAIGFESYRTNIGELAQTPSETVIDLNGKVLSSGTGITSGKLFTEFLSQEKKAFASRIPKKQPRYKQALEFLKNNHFFMEGEVPEFQIRLTGLGDRPEEFKVELEDAFFHKLGVLKYKKELAVKKIGVREYPVTLLTISMGKKPLSPGVYHLRVTGTDAGSLAYEDYCAFEVMSKDPKAPAAPLISGIPFLYNSRTETRGLETDGFDVWIGESVNQPHYISCANFQPAAARKYDVMPTVNAYGRENFLWLGSRNCDDFSIESNKDLIAKADYINVSQHKQRSNLLWRYSYHTWRLRTFVKFAKQTKDPEFKLKDLEKALAKESGELKDFFSDPGSVTQIDTHNFMHLARNYWCEWVEFANREFSKNESKFLKDLRKINPRIKYSEYGPAHIYAAHLKGAEFTSYLMAKYTKAEEHGFWQFEDYPFACTYPLERGTYYFTACLMTMPGHMLCPEIYTGGAKGGMRSGCPDGAVFYAHPPFGSAQYDPEVQYRRMIRQVYEYALASGHYTEDGFHFWDKPGFQSCGFTKPWFAELLKGWATVHDYPPARPFKTSAFVYSEESFQAGKVIVRSTTPAKKTVEECGIIDVIKTAAEDVPYAYLAARRSGTVAGFQVLMENLEKVDAAQMDTIVLPPLKGVSQKYLDLLRKLHGKGINLVAFEDVTGLEDLFGVKDTGKFKKITFAKGCGRYEDGLQEHVCSEFCGGTYKNVDGEVLVKGEIPVLIMKENPKAKAVFCNIPPHFVRLDELRERMTYGKDSISKVMARAMELLFRELSNKEVITTAGRIIAYHSKNNFDVVIITHHDEENAVSPILTVAKTAKRKTFVSCDKPCTILEDSENAFRFKVNLAPGECARFVFKR